MSYKFVKFEAQHARVEDRITVTKSNSIGFPTGFYKKNNIGGKQYVVLYWDSEAKAIGIEFLNNDSEKSKFKIIHSKTGYGGSIITRSFFRINNIDPKKYYGRYLWKKVTDDVAETLYVIELKERDKN